MEALQQNPTHTFNDVGSYNVTLNVSNTEGSSVLTKTNYITAWKGSRVLPSNNGITFYVANDAGVKYDMPNGVTTAAQGVNLAVTNLQCTQTSIP